MKQYEGTFDQDKYKENDPYMFKYDKPIFPKVQLRIKCKDANAQLSVLQEKIGTLLEEENGSYKMNEIFFPKLHVEGEDLVIGFQAAIPEDELPLPYEMRGFLPTKIPFELQHAFADIDQSIRLKLETACSL